MKRMLILLSLYCFVVAQYDDSYDNTATEMSAQDQADSDAMLDQFISDAPIVEQQAEAAPAEVAQEAPEIESVPENSDSGTAAESVQQQYEPTVSPADISTSTTTYGADGLPDDLEAKIGQTPDIPEFSHREHVEDIGAECVQCHQTLFAELVRGYKVGPSMKEICSQCHNGEDAREEVIVGFSDEKKYVKPTMPLFSHTTHIQYTEECVACHKDVYGELKKIKKVPPMSLCSECHNNHQANRSCKVCHENVNELKPKSHTPRWVYRNGHGVQARFADEKCSECHEERECNQCHRGQSSFAVHRPGYKHSHAMDARQRVSNCGYCHDTELSCARCHTRNR